MYIFDLTPNDAAETAQSEWIRLAKDILLPAAGVAGKMLWDHFSKKKQANADLNKTDAGTNQILNNMIQVSNEQLQEWKQSALDSAKLIVELQRRNGELEIKNGRLTAEVEDLKDFLTKTLVMVKSADLANFDEFEKEIHEILGE